MQAKLAAEQQLAKYQAETLPRSIKPILLESFKCQIDGNTVQAFIDNLDVYFSLCVLDNNFARAAFTVPLLSSRAYTWYTTQHYKIGAGHANKLTWERFKSDLWSYFKPPD